MSISAIIPTYRNPQYLDLCLRSAVENKLLDTTDIIVVVDGYAEESADVISKYENDISLLVFEENQGMQSAINLGVYNASTEYVFILNDDNVFPKDWDQRMAHALFGSTNTIITFNQVEPDKSIFNFVIRDLGRTPEAFQYDTWLDFETTIALTLKNESGRLFPFLLKKRQFMQVGGFDTWYQSPFWCDVDFWLKCELSNMKFARDYSCQFYHFGSRATKFGPEGDAFRQSETVAAQQFKYKWGYVPNIVQNVSYNNTKFPLEGQCIMGVDYIRS